MSLFQAALTQGAHFDRNLIATCACHIKGSDQGRTWPKMDYIPPWCRLTVQQGDYSLLCLTRKSQTTVKINYRINTISYCGNTSKSDWVPGECQQIHYYKQWVILKCTSIYPVNKDLVSSTERNRSSFWGKDFHNSAGIHSFYIKRSSCWFVLDIQFLHMPLSQR